MYPSCCPPGMPVPPAIGPDDLAGLVFIYPVPSLHASRWRHGCRWREPADGGDDQLHGVGLRADLRLDGRDERAVARRSSARTPAPAAGALRVIGAPRTSRGPATDGDHHRRPDGGHAAARPATSTRTPTACSTGGRRSSAWSRAAGDGGPGGDPDGDGVSNLAEQAAGRHPRGTSAATSPKASATPSSTPKIALFMPGSQPGRAVLRIQRRTAANGRVRDAVSPRPPDRLGRAARIADGEPFATLIESDVPVVVDRTVRWDATGYGAHAETAVEAPATTWYLAEGSTSGDFALFYLLQNPGDGPPASPCGSCGRAARP